MNVPILINVFQKLKMIRKYESTILKSKLNQIIILGKGSIKKQKKYGFIHIWVGGWFRVGTISIRKTKKNMPLKSILDYSKSI